MSTSTIFIHGRIDRSITTNDLERILNELSCSNRAQIGPHVIGGTVELIFRCHVYFNSSAHAFVRFTNDDRRKFIKLARAQLTEKNFPIKIYYDSILLKHY
ncbi:MAG: hypothetical protein WD512_17800 [Candidatus Paceibacterota bacterium]